MAPMFGARYFKALTSLCVASRGRNGQEIEEEQVIERAFEAMTGDNTMNASTSSSSYLWDGKHQLPLSTCDRLAARALACSRLCKLYASIKAVCEQSMLVE